MKIQPTEFPKKWDNVFQVGVPVIDEQHERLFCLIKDLETMQRKEQGSNLVNLSEAFFKIAQFAGDQLIREEMYLQGIESPTLPGHKTLHKEFINQIVAFQQQLQAGENPLDQTVEYLKSWFVNHCLNYDKEALKGKA